MTRKICVVTGTRAEYGLLYPLLRQIDYDPEFELQMVVTAMHLSPEFGLTYKQIETDGFVISEKIEMLLSSDTPVGISKSMGLATIGFSEAFQRLRPDLLVLLGDRYEILAAAQSAMIARIPIAHIGGGDTTEGAFDEAIRHSLTKMSHLHFVTNNDALRRIVQMGENPVYVFNVGSMGIEKIKQVELLGRCDLEKRLKFRMLQRNLLITFHPETLIETSVTEQFEEVLKAFDRLGSDIGLIFTKPNADPGGRIIIGMIDDYVKNRSNAVAFTSLGSLLYLSAVSHVDVVVGNSSTGLYEVPSFKKPTVNIGNRQKGRIQATSVINCRHHAEEIERAILAAFEKDCSEAVNPYGDGKTSEKIIKILKQINNYNHLLQKRFCEV